MNQFQLGRILGQGSFGKVYQAIHIKTNKTVAIKVLEKDKIRQKDDETRVKRQLQILKMLNHTNIAKLYQVIETESSINLIMQHAQHGDLLEYLKKQKKLSETETKRIIYQLSRAVHYIHSKGVVHRDIKMGNILLDKQFNVKLADFGLSNTFQEQQTLYTSTGSPCFAAPQIIQGKEYFPKPCDVWSIGVVMYCLLSGNLPFYHENIYQLYNLVINAIYKKLNSVSKQAEQLISLILKPNPRQRIQLDTLLNHHFFDTARKQIEFQMSQQKSKLIYKALQKLGFSKMQIKSVLSAQPQFSSTSVCFQLLKKSNIDQIKKLIYYPISADYKSKSIVLKRSSGLRDAYSRENLNESVTSSQRRFMRSISEKKKLNPLSSMKKIKQNLQGITYLKTPSNNNQIAISKSIALSRLSINNIGINQSNKTNLNLNKKEKADLKTQKITIHQQEEKKNEVFFQCSPNDFKHEISRKSIQLKRMLQEYPYEYKLDNSEVQLQLNDQEVNIMQSNECNSCNSQYLPRQKHKPIMCKQLGGIPNNSDSENVKISKY